MVLPTTEIIEPAILGVDIEKATQLINEMEQLGLIRFDEFGNVGILVLEGQS
ncbi:hypothetical protein [Streptococcus suis]|uniref:hypothetical protein n=1 Tax=Streptococcus suis TaxID=1307 RepID=UPI002AC8DB56|nr:hypothetical protein [Streptococcus suis]